MIRMLFGLTTLWLRDPAHSAWVYGRWQFRLMVLGLALVDLAVIALLVLGVSWLAARGIRLA